MLKIVTALVFNSYQRYFEVFFAKNSSLYVKTKFITTLMAFWKIKLGVVHVVFPRLKLFLYNGIRDEYVVQLVHFMHHLITAHYVFNCISEMKLHNLRKGVTIKGRIPVLIWLCCLVRLAFCLNCPFCSVWFAKWVPNHKLKFKTIS